MTSFRVGLFHMVVSVLAQWQSTQRSHITPMYRFVASPSLPRQTKYEDVDS
ncbi:hypothetical protein [Alteromonas mediterranea]|uniref:hypothetical protein n=1 Tax=Alteromonas mediterranea TaxID=314275 RepID=UPI00143C4E87|nr:hypothetical protein [Alteromonas mediterranea]